MDGGQVQKRLNEVLEMGSVMPADDTISYDLDASVHKSELGDFNKACRNLVLERTSRSSHLGREWYSVEISLTEGTRKK